MLHLNNAGIRQVGMLMCGMVGAGVGRNGCDVSELQLADVSCEGPAGEVS